MDPVGLKGAKGPKVPKAPKAPDAGAALPRQIAQGNEITHNSLGPISIFIRTQTHKAVVYCHLQTTTSCFAFHVFVLHL